MIIDAHCHLEPELSSSRLIEAMDRAGVDRAVLIAAAQAPVASIPKVGPPVYKACMTVRPLRMPMYRLALRSRRLHPYPRLDNDSVFAAAQAHPERLIPFVFLNPALGDEAHEDLDRYLSSGVRGVKLHPYLHGYRLTAAIPILKRCEAAGLPVLAHLGVGPPEDVAAVLDACPRIKLVLAHAGIPHFERLWRLERVLFDVAGLTGGFTWVPRHLMRSLLRAVGPARVVYGSDAPFGLRTQEGHRYDLPLLPDRAMGENFLALLS